jgi:hypothetical protein
MYMITGITDLQKDSLKMISVMLRISPVYSLIKKYGHKYE